MLIEPPYILCFGKEEMLLRTRRQLLMHAGYESVSTTDNLTVKECLLRGSVSLLILCHTLTHAEVESISRFRDDSQETASILCLHTGKHVDCAGCNELYDARSGPAAFIAAVNELCGATSDPASICSRD